MLTGLPLSSTVFRTVLGSLFAKRSDSAATRKGERGTTVVYADRFTLDDERRRAAEAGEEPGAIPFLKRFTVFRRASAMACPRRSLLRSFRRRLARLSPEPRR
jgi:hypothetical protein